jgi:DNA repair protein RadD
MRPRPYQIRAVESTLDCLFHTPGANPVVAVPPGGGKSSLIAWTTKAIRQRVPTARVMVSTHVKELVDQDSSELERIWPDAPYGIYSAGLNSKQADYPITISSIQSAVKNIDAFGKQNVLMIDEAHLVSPAAESNYQKLIKGLREKNSNLAIVAYSATPWRMKHGKIADGPIFNCVAFDNTQRDDFVALIDDAYLVPVIPKQTSFEYDVTQVRKVGGEFNAADLQKAVDVDELTEQALQEALQAAHDRKHWLIFCSGLSHVENVTKWLLAHGEKAVFVHSKMAGSERDRNIAAFKGEAWAVKELGFMPRQIVSEGILTTGFNAPWTDCIVLLRPTSSPGLHVQILGRGIRTVYGGKYSWEELEELSIRQHAIELGGKLNCLVLDFAGNTARLGPINDPVVPARKGKGTGEVPIKICPSCGTYNHAAARFCIGVHWDGKKCNHEFLFETKLENTASTEILVARDQPQMAWFKVDRVEYDYFQRGKGLPHMRVHYFCGMRRFTESVSIEHENNYYARKWWKEHVPKYPPPPDTATGMTFVQHLPRPTNIYVWVNRKYPQILKRSFDGTTPEYRS